MAKAQYMVGSKTYKRLFTSREEFSSHVRLYYLRNPRMACSKPYLGMFEQPILLYYIGIVFITMIGITIYGLL